MRPVCACEERLIAIHVKIVAVEITFETLRDSKFIKGCSLRSKMGPFPCKHIVSGRHCRSGGQWRQCLYPQFAAKARPSFPFLSFLMVSSSARTKPHLALAL